MNEIKKTLFSILIVLALFFSGLFTGYIYSTRDIDTRVSERTRILRENYSKLEQDNRELKYNNLQLGRDIERYKTQIGDIIKISGELRDYNNQSGQDIEGLLNSNSRTREILEKIKSQK